MSMRGGYQIIDLKNVPLYSGFLQDNGENHIHVKGIYYNLYHSNAKMILLSGLNMDNKPHRDYEIIPYEEDNEFKAILKKVWNTDKHMVYTYFLHIAEDDDVYITYEELDYDRVDKEFNEDSDVAIANSTVTKKVKALDKEDLKFVKLDGSRYMIGDLNFNGKAITNSLIKNSTLGTNLSAGNHEIINLAVPTGVKSAVPKGYVDDINTNNHAYFNGGNIDSSSSSTSFNVMITNKMFIGSIVARNALTSVGNTIPVDNDQFKQIKLIAKSLGVEDVISFSCRCPVLVNGEHEIIQVVIRIDINSTTAGMSFTAGTATQQISDGIYTFYGVI
nr:MAG TPA: hypothetical protein [Caudoviricetes sp.]